MGNKTDTVSIRGGNLSTMIHSIQHESTIPHDKWYTILASRTCSIALLDDTFKYMIHELHQADIPSEYYYKILEQPTASMMIYGDKPAFQRVIGALRVSGVDVQMWHRMLVTSPVINAISNGSLPKMIRNLKLDGSSRHEWHTRIVTDLVRLCTLRCTCTPSTCVCRCHNVVDSATDKKKIVSCVCECRAHTQSVSIAGLQEEY